MTRGGGNYVIPQFPSCIIFRIRERVEERRVKLGEALALHQFFRDIDDEEAWIREKRLLVSSEDFGRDLIAVQNLKKKHKRLEGEIVSHEPTINQIQEAGIVWNAFFYCRQIRRSLETLEYKYSTC